MTWYFKNKEFTSDDINKAFGFVYLITDKLSGKKYIGQKHFWSKKTVQKNKVKKKVKCESDWQKYCSSSDILIKSGVNNLHREILCLCISKGQLNYIETKLQFDFRVLENQNIWLNGIVNIRCHHSHHKMDRVVDYDSELISKLYKQYHNPFLV